jgi:predicted nucleotidyltransferase/predicted transcriptional regulator with HTH domain
MREYDGSAFLGRSTIRRRILAILIDSSRERYHLREIARRANTSAGTAARELDRLGEARLVVSQREGNLRYFRVDTASPLYEPVRDLVRRTIGAPAVLRRHLGIVAGIESAVIFGSYADGRLKADSDIDILVVGKPNRDQLTEALEAASGELGREVNEVVMTRDELDRRRAAGDGLVRSIDSGRVSAVIG